jgi:hypothetical protein
MFRRMSFFGVPGILGLWLVAGTQAGLVRGAVKVDVYPAAPVELVSRARGPVQISRDADGDIELGNAFLTAGISSRGGALRSVVNHLTAQRLVLNDIAGTTISDASGKIEWQTGDLPSRRFHIETMVAGDGAEGRVTLSDASGDVAVRVVYTLGAGDFWIQRRLIIEPPAPPPAPRAPRPPRTIDQIIYGAAKVEGGDRRVLTLGKFDRPSIVTTPDGSGGIFAGVGHWFYRTDEDGRYFNADMAWQQSGEFQSEPWYLGVFMNEPGEPYPGWTWYKSYLERTKSSMAKHAAWFSWNAGWGQWGIDIDDPAAGDYLELMHRLGVDGVIFGSGGFGKGIARFTELAENSPAAQKNLALLHQFHIAGGTLNNGSRKWGDATRQSPLRRELDRYAGAGFGSMAFDFFSSPDTYAAHRRVAEYFRAAHDELDYTECHLGMAAYGPQFQRLVRVNHPDDIGGFDISHFSANWATFLAFRQSRRNWQQRYQYLMPEDGLYYYLTHYGNWGNPRRYTDPEPQQFLWSVPAYCGIGFNFHDVFGWRETIAASSAFTTAPVFGYLDLKMPARDVEFARSFFAWMRQNASILAAARVCEESETHCVVSKIQDGRGLIYVINYAPGAREFEMALKLGSARGAGDPSKQSRPLSVRQVYPSREDAQAMAENEVLRARVSGESAAIFEINGALRSFPPENRSRFPVDLNLKREQGAWTASFTMPDIRDALSGAADPSLPRELLSLDQVQDSRPDLLVKIAADEKRQIPAVKWIGKGKLPRAFLDVYGFQDDETVETWKIVPWAFADRVWLVIRPAKPVPLTGPHPTLKINGISVELVPRVDHRFKELSEWNCPLYHADITGAVRFDHDNEIAMVIPGQDDAPIATVTSAAGQR